MKKKLMMLAVVLLSGSLFAGCGKSEVTTCPDGQITVNGACQPCPAGQKPNATKTACEVDLCGNGKKDEGETCDDSSNKSADKCSTIEKKCKNDGCSVYKVEHAGTCQAKCVEDKEAKITEAKDGDGCCPDGKTFSEDNDCGTPVGQPCKGNSDCAEGLRCFKEDSSNRLYKEGACYKGCSTSKDCPGAEESVGCFPIPNRKPEDPDICLPKCKVDTDCRFGYVCSGNFCRPTDAWCEKDADCNDGKGFKCLTDPPEGEHKHCILWGTGTGNVGDECESEADCAGGEGVRCERVLGHDHAKKGFCTKSCKTADGRKGCSGVGEMDFCAPDSFDANTNTPSPEGTCIKSCKKGGNECDSGVPKSLSLVCTVVGEVGVCSYPKSSMTTVGKECSSDDECGSEIGTVCLNEKHEANPLTPDGYCSLDCLGDFECPDDAICLSGGGGVSRFGFCFKKCKLASDCRTGYTCNQRYTQGKGYGLCLGENFK